MDLTTIAKLVAGEGGRLRLRQAEVTAVAGDGTLTVLIGGSGVAVSGVKAFASAQPVVGESVWLVTDGVDLMAIGSMGPTPYCCVSRSTTQSIPNATHTDVSFDTVVTDPLGMFDAGQPTRITVPTDGAYLVSATFTFAVNSSGRRQFKARQWTSGGVLKNYAGATFVNSLASYSPVGSPCQLVGANAGDYFTLTPWQDSGGALDVVAGSVMRVLRMWTA